MPAIGPVYQPTTYNIGYEPHHEWPRQIPNRRWYSTWANRCDFGQWNDRVYLGAVFVLLGLMLFFDLKLGQSFISGDSYLFEGGPYNATSIIVFTAITFFCLAILLHLYLKYVHRQKYLSNWFRCCRKENTNCSARGGQITSDLLVTSAQYGPVVEAPPTMNEEDETETHTLMEAKETNEESDLETKLTKNLVDP